MPYQNMNQPQSNGLWEFFFGSPTRYEQADRYNPQQNEALDMLLSQGLQGLQSGNVNLGPLEQQARSQFQQQTIPSIAERFTAGGGQRSSAFGQQLGAAGAGLEEGLASMRYQQLFNLLNGGLQQRYDTTRVGPQEGFLGQALRYAPTAIGAAFGAPIPPMQPSQPNQARSQAFTPSENQFFNTFKPNASQFGYDQYSGFGLGNLRG